MRRQWTDVVTASEIASWTWCPEAWRLGELGGAPANEVELARGETFHDRTARVEVSSQRATALGRWLIVCGLLTTIVILVFLKVAGQ